ncbi:YqgE/AlgH family protein [Reichenbachiella sp. MALMAid0571]|uniref:YqgE/AlgH family protein n=1 Tax=Reichenbachiella sp. MALMAid0571 TaxID=3143939 RepID=UPI0032DFC5A2
MDYFLPKNEFKAERGDLLISEPFLPDPNFERTVILLCEHDEHGSFGFVLNKQSTVEFQEVIEGGADFSEKLFIGGPVQQDTLHFIHRAPDQMESGKEIVNGIYWGGDFERLLSLINTKQLNVADYRFFLGYSGWSEGQLENELKAKSWIVYKQPTAEKLFDLDPEKLWKEALKELGGKFKMFSNYPEDPRLN